jgi:hypothetical protein
MTIETTTVTNRAAWLRKRPFGVMVHYLPVILDREGTLSPADWEDAVDAFDVPRFCAEIARTGAQWLIFPFGQNTGKYCAPNPVLDRFIGGYTCRRNLAKEIALELRRRDISFVGYLPTEVWSREREFQDALGWHDDPADKTLFHRRYEQVVRYWTEDLGTLMSGMWLDGCYQASEKCFLPPVENQWDNSRFTASWFEAVRAGNPDLAIAMNLGANCFDCIFPQQDFLAGEVDEPLPPPEEAPVAKHALLWLDCFWMFKQKPEKPDAKMTMPPPRFSRESLSAWLTLCHQRDCGVTFNLGIYRDGTLADQSVELLKEL